MEKKMFQNRQQAGRLLGAQIQREAHIHPKSDYVVIALPRGGVAVGFEVAKALQLPLDVLVTRKMGAPSNPELGIGAITESGYYWIDETLLESMPISFQEIKALVSFETQEVERRIRKYRGDLPLMSLEGKTVILVDDGLLTGSTARVASRYLKQKCKAKKVILAVPVCSEQPLRHLRSEVDHVICLEKSNLFLSIGAFYQEFAPVLDDDVLFFLNGGKTHTPVYQEILIADGDVRLPGYMTFPASPHGLIIFSQGNGSGRFDPRNQQIAQVLNQAGFATLLFDLLTEEESIDHVHLFDTPFLARRLVGATRWVISWLNEQRIGTNLPLGYLGENTGASAALWAAADLKNEISTVVSRGGRPDLALSRLKEVKCPVFLIIGALDEPIVEMNKMAMRYIPTGRLLVISGASHFFEESGALEAATRNTQDWFSKNMIGRPQGIAA